MKKIAWVDNLLAGFAEVCSFDIRLKKQITQYLYSLRAQKLLFQAIILKYLTSLPVCFLSKTQNTKNKICLLENDKKLENFF